MLYAVLCRLAVSDVVQYSFDGGRGKLWKNVINSVLVHGQPLPVDETALMQSQTVPLQAVVASGLAVHTEKERLQNAVNFLRRRLDRIAVFLASPLDNQQDIDGQANLNRDRDGRVGGVAEVGGQRAAVG